jgi:hypothetical protein
MDDRRFSRLAGGAAWGPATPMVGLWGYAWGQSKGIATLLHKFM